MPRNHAVHLNLEMLSAKLGDAVSTLQLTDNDVVYTQGSVADSAFYLQSGQVKLAVVSETGKEAVIGLLTNGHFFGESCLLANRSRRLSNATAIGVAVAIRLERTATIRLLHEDAEFAEVFLSYMIRRTKRVEEDLIDQLFNSTEKRLARVLLLLANYGSEDGPPQNLPKISQETLAQMVGASRSRVSQFLNKFRDLGFIEYNGDLRVHKSLLNVVLHD